MARMNRDDWRREKELEEARKVRDTYTHTHIYTCRRSTERLHVKRVLKNTVCWRNEERTREKKRARATDTELRVVCCVCVLYIGWYCSSRS